uniref:Homeodomain-only protein n=1 Tax=Castor canadensis TaxID=51338 RepID=A0A8B7W4X3_CASCN|nr:homeodomain-only protein isoform X1 [Castor canadensis]XP_020037363.1 homeodomain-only protein isoform X1 [Castor canadensis]XP_020037364.1 homeodomain-only protein isoform X1 [Castor canadensis]XP_020037365.1 homeodomain-only protein isoform X1 [Castor canadensis]XP_020037366.1 homeodomain-only protein isoform X1 [Castor canadensis]XP_020037367.1 homeodomain-only protein isoform X1 [Castor canadensis]
MSAETASGPTEDQVEILEYNFNKVNKHPDPTTLCLIAAEAGLSEEETQTRAWRLCALLTLLRNGLSSAWPSGGGRKACPQSADLSQTREMADRRGQLRSMKTTCCFSPQLKRAILIFQCSVVCAEVCCPLFNTVLYFLNVCN